MQNNASWWVYMQHLPEQMQQHSPVPDPSYICMVRLNSIRSGYYWWSVGEFVQKMSICCWHCPGIPTLVLADEENKIISYNARFVVANDVEGKVWASATCLYLLTYLPTYLLTETLWLYTNHLTPVISVKKKTFILLKNYCEVNNKCCVGTT